MIDFTRSEWKLYYVESSGGSAAWFQILTTRFSVVIGPSLKSPTHKEYSLANQMYENSIVVPAFRFAYFDLDVYGPTSPFITELLYR